MLPLRSSCFLQIVYTGVQINILLIKIHPLKIFECLIIFIIKYMFEVIRQGNEDENKNQMTAKLKKYSRILEVIEKKRLNNEISYKRTHNNNIGMVNKRVKAKKNTQRRGINIQVKFTDICFLLIENYSNEWSHPSGCAQFLERSQGLLPQTKQYLLVIPRQYRLIKYLIYYMLYKYKLVPQIQIILCQYLVDEKQFYQAIMQNSAESQSEFIEYTKQLKSQQKSKQNAKISVTEALRKGQARLESLKQSLNNKLKEPQRQKQKRLRKSSAGSNPSSNKEFVKKIKKWVKEKESLQQRRKDTQAKNLSFKMKMQEQANRQKQEEKQFKMSEKKRNLQLKIKAIQERKLQRQANFKSSGFKKSPSQIPKYLQFQQRFQEQQSKQQQLFTKKLLRNKNNYKPIDPQQLRAHQKAYIQRIKARLNIGSQNEKSKQIKSDFNVYIKQNQQVRQKQLQKIMRRNKFQQKINQIPIHIDQNKQIQSSISKDKIKNPQKYHFLSQKALSDRQIFQQFKDFKINIDSKQIGKNYLQSLKDNNKNTIKSVQNLHDKNMELKMKSENNSKKESTQFKTKSNSIHSLPINSNKLNPQQNFDSRTNLETLILKKVRKINPLKEQIIKKKKAISQFEATIFQKKKKDDKIMNAIKKKLSKLD